MDTSKLRLYHLGDICTPGLIINDILGEKNKKLFMLGNYAFNDILAYLEDDDLDSIYDRGLLEVMAEQKNWVKHTKYNFMFNHDYTTSDDMAITNYEQVAERFQEKLRDWRTMRDDSESDVVFVHCSVRLPVRELRVREMMAALRKQRPAGNIHLLIFTDQPVTEEDAGVASEVPNVTLMRVEGHERIMYPWELHGDDRANAEAHVHAKFLKGLAAINR